jgi:hypothetical protein
VARVSLDYNVNKGIILKYVNMHMFAADTTMQDIIGEMHMVGH